MSKRSASSASASAAAAAARDGAAAAAAAPASDAADSPSAAKKSRSGDNHTTTSTGASSSCAAGSVRLATTTAAGVLRYLHGFGAELQSEALPNALPAQNTPQTCPYGLFAEQLSGTSFTTPRKDNQRSWLYRIRPTAGHPPFQPVETQKEGALASALVVSDFSSCKISPNQYRWQPFSMAQLSGRRQDFVQGLATVAGHGAPDGKNGLAIHIYTCNANMENKGYVNSDGDLLIVPQEGVLHVRTEFGMLRVAPGFICVVQRGMVFSVNIEGPSRGYICEVYNGHFKLPELGPIGANGLANARDFQYPTAQFENTDTAFTVVQKFVGRFFSYERKSSPYDVVAWHGNYVPFMYDLSKFCPVNAVRFDHLDPSIFTVLTVATTEPGVAACDFVIFPPRWAVQEHTFRPPYYHRNCMSEFMGNIMGMYEAKKEGFLPGGASLHSCMASHGPDAATFDRSSSGELKPQRLTDNSLSFMFESTFMFKVTEWALTAAAPDADYWKVWTPINPRFDPTNPNPVAAPAAASRAK